MVEDSVRGAGLRSAELDLVMTMQPEVIQGRRNKVCTDPHLRGVVE